MGCRRRQYKLDDGRVVDFKDVMYEVGTIKKGAAVKRLRCSSDPVVVFAPKGTISGLYKKPEHHKDFILKLSKEEQLKQEKERDELALTNHILKTRPLYKDGFLKLALTSINSI